MSDDSLVNPSPPPKSSFELKVLSVDLLEPNEWNPQEQSEATFNRLREEIRNVGFIDPIEVIPLDTGKYRILGGEHRWRAAMAEGMTEVPVISLTDKKWADVDLQKFTSVRVNVLKGDLNPEKFAKLYNQMADKYGAEALQGLMGFTNAKGFQKLLGGIHKGIKKSLGDEAAKKFEEGAKETKTVEELSHLMQDMFAQYGDTLDQNFMVFSHGKKQHLFIAMSAQTKRAMEKVTEYCKMTKEDINEIMAPIILKCAKEAEKKMAESFSDTAPAPKDPETYD